MLKKQLLITLKSMQSDYPNVLSDEKMFKALAKDLFENNHESKAVLRHLCIALFEYDALSLLKSDIERSESFAATKLSKGLMDEGAQHSLAMEVTGYLLILSGQDEKIVEDFLNENRKLAASVIAPLIPVTFGGHEWLVLEEREECSLLLSAKVFEKRAYDNTDTETTWETCTMRKYLNTIFLDSFTAEEKSQIETCEIVNSNNPWFESEGGGNTEDKIFLLSLDDVVKYFGDTGQLHNPPAKKMWISDPGYNKSRIALDDREVAVVWWLRSPGETNRTAAAVLGNGFIVPAGFAVSNDEGGVRPAMWVRL